MTGSVAAPRGAGGVVGGIVPPTERGAVAMLLLAALLWGSGNVANKTLLDHVGPFTALAIRCLLALLVVLPLLRFDGTGRTNGRWLASALGVATLFVGATATQQVAYRWTSVTNVSFLVNTCPVMAAGLAWLLLRQRPGWRLSVAAIATVSGAALMSGVVTTRLAMNPGDVACLVSAFLYAGGMVAMSRHLLDHGRPMATSAVSFGLAAAVMLPLSLAVEAPTTQGVAAAWRELLFLGLFSTAASCVLLTLAQRHVAAPLAAVLVSSESVFGAAGAFLLLGERTYVIGLLGGALILGAVALAARDSGPSRGPRRAEAGARPAGNRSCVFARKRLRGWKPRSRPGSRPAGSPLIGPAASP